MKRIKIDTHKEPRKRTYEEYEKTNKNVTSYSLEKIHKDITNEDLKDRRVFLARIYT